MGERRLRVREVLQTALLALLAMALLGACDDATGPGLPAGSQVVSLSLSIGPGSAAPAPALFAAGLELSDGVNTLTIESAELVLRELEFERVETTGCDSELEDDDCEEFEVGPFLVALPLDGSVSTQIEAVVETGTYDEIEFEFHKPDDGDPADQDFIAAHPDFADISIRVTGTYNTQPFEYTTALNEEQEVELSDPLVVGPDAGPLNVTLTLDISTWYRAPDGTYVDPRTAVDGGANETLVTDNIRNSIEGFRDDDEDGVPHSDDNDELDDSDMT